MEWRRGASSLLSRAALSVSLLCILSAFEAKAQERGFRLHRYEGSTTGSWLFLVDRPWYSSMRFGAAGVTIDYSHRPLQPKVATGRGSTVPIVDHAIVGHADLALALFDRFLLSASLPLTMLEVGSTELVSQVGPLGTMSLGDPRFGLMVRILGQPDRDRISLHVGADVWVPIGAADTHQGDTGIRLRPRVILAGTFGAVGRWTVEGAFLWRPYSSYGPPALGLTAASEARLGVAVGAALLSERLYVGPEAQFSTQVQGANALAVNGMSLELLAGAQYLLGEQVMIGVAGGTAFLGAAGTPDARAMVRLTWAPRRDSDRDGISNMDDACPEVSGKTQPAREHNGCPDPIDDDADDDGVSDAADHCPFEPETLNGVRDLDGCPELEMAQGSPIARILTAATPKTIDAGVTVKPRPSAPIDAGTAVALPVEELDAGAPLVAVPFGSADSDGDGVVDEADRCPVTADDPDGFEDEDGCPELDNDGDGVLDSVDQCPTEAETINGVNDQDGCPDVAPDGDQDGVADAIDRCPFEPETIDNVRDDDGCPEHPIDAQPALSKILVPPTPPPLPGGALIAVEAERAPPPPADSDGDGIDDEADRCPISAEDRDDFEDEDGCPEPDNDDDGIADANDKCREVAETINGSQDEDGCPDEHPDVDGDGVNYEDDRCPLEVGRRSADGCPHWPAPALALPGFAAVFTAPKVEAGAEASAAAVKPDFDRDGSPDDEDRCPVSAEDMDEFEDDDGCPEPDNDRDGVPDGKDKCPFEAETINGNKDDDGCPDLGVGAVSIKAGEVVLNGVIRFKPGSATFERASVLLLNQVASTLKAASTISVEIQGHTDDTGSAAINIRLSKRRADAIRAHLIKSGVAAARLLANGYGPQRPRASNKTVAGREQNRRVEFLILGEEK